MPALRSWRWRGRETDDDSIWPIPINTQLNAARFDADAILWKPGRAAPLRRSATAPGSTGCDSPWRAGSIFCGCSASR
jgi:hypothetical protein